jgi:hypothetical protein
MARVLATDLIEMLQAAVSVHGRDLEVHGNFSNEGSIELRPVSQVFGGSLIVGIYHSVIPVENDEHQALRNGLIEHRRWGMFGDGLEDDYAEGGMGSDRPPYNYTADEIREVLGDEFEEDDDDDSYVHFDP